MATLLPIGILILAFEARGVAKGTTVTKAWLGVVLALIPALTVAVGVVGTLTAASVAISGGKAGDFEHHFILFAGIAVYGIAGAIAVFQTYKNFRHGVTTKKAD